MWEAGGFPVELPAMTLAEPFQKPTTMMYRNFLAMETEELLRSHPADGAVLMGGCDKTTPALLMGAISMNLPAIYMPAGPMLRGNWRGKTLGSGSDVWKYWAELRAGNITEQDWEEIEDGIARSPGHCMTMGTASTMTSAAEALGMTLPGAASIPAADSRHAVMATRTGKRIVEMVWEDLKPSDLITRRCFPQRRRRGAGDRRLDQCDRASDRHGAPRGRGARPGGVRQQSRARRRCSPTSGPPAPISWRIFTTPAACPRCSSNWRICGS